MPKIVQAITKLWITKTQFWKLFKQATWEKLDAKEKEISSEILKKIEKLATEITPAPKTASKATKVEEKVLKIEEFDTEENWFLSWLWFQKEEEPQKEEKEKESFFEFQTNDSVTVSLEKWEASWYKSNFAKKERRNQKTPMDWRTEIDFYKNQFQQNAAPRPQQTTTQKPTPQQNAAPRPQQTTTQKPASQRIFNRPQGQWQNRPQQGYNKNKWNFWWIKSSVQITKVTQKNNFQNRNQPQHTQAQHAAPKPEVIKKEVVAPRASDTLKTKTEIIISETITVKEFSEKMWIQLSEVMKKLFMNKIVVWANANIDFETASLIWEEFGVKVSRSSASVSVEDILNSNLQSILAQDKDEENLQERPPIVTIMWHVDHWKTKLLDYIRKTNIVAWEAGWITQSIWASQIVHNWKKITFIDTPWHELFTQLRARWSRITDIAIIVVAADDGVKQQTIEAIHHAKEAWVPIIVAITKIDRPHSNLETIKWQLAERGLTPEEWGWDIPLIKLSSVTGQWVDDLLEVIALQAEMLALKYNPARPWVWVVLEAHKDIKKWVTTSLILMTWSLKLWDVISIHNTYWKVKKMVDWKWADVKQVNWWDPVMILWLPVLPEPWRVAEVMKSEKDANIKVSLINDKEKQSTSSTSMQNVMEMISKWERVVLKLILKADSWGSHEALKFAIWKTELPENIEIKIIHSDVWNINESDIILANASSAIIIWFNIWFNALLAKKAESQKIIIKCFDIIYEIMDYVDGLAKWLVKIEEKEVIKWKLQVMGCFFRKWNDMIIWWKIIEWKWLNWVQFKVHRWEEMLWVWRVTSLKKENENVNEIWTWHECWLKVKFSKKIEIDDILEFFTME